MNDIPTPEEIATYYSDMMDRVTLLNNLKDADDWYYHIIVHNISYLRKMLLNDWWDGYDLTPIEEVIQSMG
jgi:hypothetical protein